MLTFDIIRDAMKEGDVVIATPDGLIRMFVNGFSFSRKEIIVEHLGEKGLAVLEEHEIAGCYIVKEKRILPHWPAVYEEKFLKISGILYKSEEQAKGSLGAMFIRLATEYPPIMLEVEE